MKGQRVWVTAILPVRNEGAFLLEWFAHHRACGFSDFLVFSNECSDGTDAMLDRLAVLGWLTHVRNDGPHAEGPQWAALKKADRHLLVQASDWVMPIDIDEFVNIKVGDRTIAALLAALPGATAIPMTWRFFGNAGVVAYEDLPVTQTFTRAAPAVLHWPWRASLFKTLFRRDGSYGKLGVHRPRQPDPAQMAGQAWYDGSGRRLAPAFHTARIFTDPGQDCFELAQLNHYALGAVESFLVKGDRGRSNREGVAMGADYWVDRNFCAVEDRSILALESRALREGLHADPVLGPLHQAAVDWRRARFRALMTEEPLRDLYGRLLMTPPTRVLPQALAEAIWKPHVRPSQAKTDDQ